MSRIPRGVWVLGFVSLLMDVSSEMIHSLLPVFMVTVLGASAGTVGLVEGIAEATALVVKVFSGTLSDALGKRKLLAVFGYGLGAASKPLFALAGSTGMVLAARFIDRIGKGVRGAPRDALVADLTPRELRGAAFGLRQSLDTVGAFAGPLAAIALMLLLADDFRAVFWIAVIPGALATALLVFGVREPGAAPATARPPLRWASLRLFGAGYWWIVALGTAFTLARFSEAFLVLRAQAGGLPIAWAPMVLVAMNVVYAATAYPFGKLADTMSHRRIIALGLVVLIVADAALAWGGSLAWIFAGIALWGLHMGMTQGILAAMVADAAPEELRGSAFGFFNLASGGALLVASVLAGVLWEQAGPASTFIAGGAFCVLALAVLQRSPRLT